MGTKGRPKVSDFVKISIAYKVIQYSKRYNETPYRAWFRLIKHRAFKSLMEDHYKNTSQFKNYIEKIRKMEVALGKTQVDKKKILKNKLKTITRSLFYIKDLKKGDKIQYNSIKSFRPGIGVSPNLIKKVLGKKLKYNVKKYTAIKKKHF